MIKDEKYLKEFGKMFKSAIQRLIVEEIERKKHLANQNSLTQEILEHANHANKLMTKIQDYHKDYEPIHNYITDEKNCCPFILVGSSGIGKSSLLAFVAKKVKFILYNSI